MNPQGHQTSPEPAHERKDADVFGLLLIALLLLLVLALSFLVCWGMLHLLNRGRNAQERKSPAPRVERSVTFPRPNLLVYPGKELAQGQADARHQLETYGWLDRPAGRARIPVTRAMELIVERGLPEVGVGQSPLQLRQARPQTDLQPNEPSASPAPEATP